MHSDRTLVELVGLVYEAAADPTVWVHLLETLQRRLNLEQCIFHVRDLVQGKCDVAAEIGLDPVFQKSYVEYYSARNVFFIHGEQHLSPGHVCHDSLLCDPAILRRSEFYNDWIVPQGILYGLNATVLRTESLASLLALVRRRDLEPSGEDDVSLVRALMPHLQRAVQIHKKLTNLQALAQSAASALDCWALGVLLLDRAGHVVLMNKAAEALVQRRDGLHLENGVLRAGLAMETKRLRAAIHRALLARNEPLCEPGGAIKLSRLQSERSLHVLITPLTFHHAVEAPSRTACAVFVSDPDAAHDADERLLGQLYGFTPAESRIAALLTQGKDVKELANELQVSTHTARTHVKRILTKTDTTRQAELVSVILRGVARARLR